MNNLSWPSAIVLCVAILVGVFLLVMTMLGIATAIMVVVENRRYKKMLGKKP